MAAIAKVFPVYQPVLGTIGTGLDALANISTTNPLETAATIVNVADNINKNSLDASYQDLRTQLAPLDPSKAQNARGYVKAVLPAVKKMSAFQQQARLATQSSQAPQSEIEAELGKLKAEDPGFVALSNSVANLTQEKEDLARHLADTIQRVNGLSDKITSNLLSIQVLNDDANAGIASLNPKTVQYLDDIERRANETLLKYHYYVAKAYEYRLLQPYPFSLSLQGQFKQLLDVAVSDDKFQSLKLGDPTVGATTASAPPPEHSPMLTEAEFNRLAGVYRDNLRGILKDVTDLYNNARPERNDKFYYSLNDYERERLNKDGAVVVNLARAGRIRADEENQRIASISGLMEAKLTSASTEASAVKVTYELPVESKVHTSRGSYVFRHPDSIQWATSCNFKTSNGACEVNDVAPSAGNNSPTAGTLAARQQIYGGSCDLFGTESLGKYHDH
jgi:hypothetical protein